MNNAQIVISNEHNFEQEITGAKKLYRLWLWLGVIFAAKAML